MAEANAMRTAASANSFLCVLKYRIAVQKPRSTIAASVEPSLLFPQQVFGKIHLAVVHGFHQLMPAGLGIQGIDAAFDF